MRSRIVQAGAVLAIIAGVALAGCRAGGPSHVKDPAEPSDLPGWSLVTAVAMPGDGVPVAIMGRGRFRTFGWANSNTSDAHRWGFADLQQHTVTLSRPDDRWTTTGNWSDGDRVVHVMLAQKPDEETVRFRVSAQRLPDGPEQVLDVSDGAVPLADQPGVAFAGDTVVWSRWAEGCRCRQVVSAAPEPAGVLGPPVVVLSQRPGLTMDADGGRVLVVSAQTRVVDLASHETVVLPVQGAATGSIRGPLVAVLSTTTGPTGDPSQTVAVFRVPPGGGPPQLLRRHDVPPDVGQVDFVDDRRLLLFSGEDQTLDVVTGVLTPLPMAPIDAGSRYAVGDGTLTVVTRAGGRSWLAVYRPTAP